MILKIQRPLSTNMKEPMALVYNKSRSDYAMIPWPKVATFFRDGELKIYVDGRIEEADLVIVRKLKPRDW